MNRFSIDVLPQDRHFLSRCHANWHTNAPKCETNVLFELPHNGSKLVCSDTRSNGKVKVEEQTAPAERGLIV